MKILLLDIETAPNVAHVWGLWQQNVGLPQIMAAGYVMCWAAKWYGDREVFFDSVYQSSHKKMLRGIHKLLDQADVAVHYNGRKFDVPTLNKEFLVHDMLPPSPYDQIDLLQTARSRFRFPSNKLDYISQALKLGKKTKHEGHELWIKCMAKDPDAWRTMEKYNKNDVVLLEKVYDKMRPWIRSHPNHGTHDQTVVCPSCGKNHHQRRGYATTKAYRYARFQCLDCGTWFRSAKTEFRQKLDRFTAIAA